MRDDEFKLDTVQKVLDEEEEQIEDMWQVEQGNGEVWKFRKSGLNTRISNRATKYDEIELPEEDALNYDEEVARKQAYLDRNNEFQALLDKVKELE